MADKTAYLVNSFDKSLGLLDPIKPWLYEVYFHPNNPQALSSVSALWSDWRNPNHIRAYAKSITTPGRSFNVVGVPFFGIEHKYPGKPNVTQEFDVKCYEFQNQVMMNYVEKWMNLIANVDESFATGNSAMFSTAETIYDLCCTVDIKNLGTNGKQLPRYTSYTCAWPSKISAGDMANQSSDTPPTKTITFTCLLPLTKKN